ncbi:MAG TPA: ATP-binding cassette domain-containing protein, partial [Burkholderiales bacterium]|nr:ATP-binding cassette domain-containing protein [Burkholderiales bacterium]
MIRFDKVSKRFRIPPGPRRKAGVVDALLEVSAHIAAGEVIAVAGPNGAGKSPLFSLLLGFLEPTGGELSIAGDDPRSYVRKHGAGYLPERFRLPPEWRVGDVLRAFASIDRISRLRAQDTLERFGLAGHAQKNVAALSH